MDRGGASVSVAQWHIGRVKINRMYSSPPMPNRESEYDPNMSQFGTYSETITICPNMVIIPNFRYVLGELKWAGSDLPFFGVDDSAITGLLLIFVFLGGAIQIYTISLDPPARP